MKAKLLMHTTIVKTKDGQEYKGVLWFFRPAFNYITLLIWDGKNENEKEFSFDECESITTLNERLTKNTIGDCDEMLRAKKMLDDGRKHGWTEQGKPYPVEKFEWEKKYDN